MAAEPLAPGEVIAGKYEIVRVLGKGGMGIVYLGVHQRLGHRVAIKTLVGEARADHEACVRFEREARAAVKLKSRFVARVTDVETLPDDSPAMVMEFLEGHTLGRELEDRGRLTVGESVDFVLQACSALQEAHGLGIIHRDIKPENLFLADEGGERHVKVLDFGISKIVDGDDRRVTTTGLVLGTPMYMSPEQIRSTKNVDHRCDIWSLGVVLYESLTGRPPFDGESSVAVIAAITADDPRTPYEWEDDIPLELSNAVMKALGKAPSARYVDVAEFAAAIQPFAGSFDFVPVAARESLVGARTNPKDEPRAAARSSGSISLGGGIASTVASQRTERTWSGDAPQPSRGRRSLQVGAAAALVLGLGAAAAFKLIGSKPHDASATVASPSPLANAEATSAPKPADSTLVAASPSASASSSSPARPMTSVKVGPQPSSRPTASTSPAPAAPPAPRPASAGRPVAGDGHVLNL